MRRSRSTVVAKYIYALAMSLPDDLLEQAGHLASRERTKPKQASLRRAISVSYYAVFHLLVDDATKLILPGQDGRGRVAELDGLLITEPSRKYVSPSWGSRGGKRML
jgi:hypothetical protein